MTRAGSPGGTRGGASVRILRGSAAVALVGSLLAALGGVPAAAAESLLRLPLGDPSRRDRRVELVLDGITDSRTGEQLAPHDLPARLEGARLLFVGEQHVDVEFHRIQLRVIEELQRAGRKVSIGLEMFPYTEQRSLDQWTAGLLTERGFLELADWYEHWGYDWKYYREILLFARDHGLAMYALNTPRDVVRAVRRKGLENLNEEEARHVPPSIDTASAEHLRLFRAMFEEDADDDFHAALPEAELRAMFEAQCTWDATMGHSAVQALRRDDDPRAILVVMVGAGHVAYDLGIQRQARQWFDGRMASILPVSVGDACEPEHEVQASYADFVWGVPPAEQPFHPFLGLSTTESDGRRKVIHVSPDSPAERAGFAPGDVLLSMDGQDLSNQRTLKRLTAEKQWGDRAVFAISRGDERIERTVYLRRTRPEPCEAARAGEKP